VHSKAKRKERFANTKAYEKQKNEIFTIPGNFKRISKKSRKLAFVPVTARPSALLNIELQIFAKH
jgi:hypothetical protein